MQSMVPFKYVLKIIRIAKEFDKYKDPNKIKEMFKNAPDNVKEKINSIIDIVNSYNNGEIDRDTALNEIANILGVEANDIMDMVSDFIEILKSELE